jgi:hypothetical protein
MLGRSSGTSNLNSPPAGVSKPGKVDGSGRFARLNGN